MKRMCCLLAVLLCMVLCLPAVAAPADTDKAYELRFTAQGTGGVYCLTQETAFWEYPLLKAGQCRTGGTLRFTNRTAEAVQIGVQITLPYENTAALGYLNYVRIRVVRHDGTVVYDGPYCRIADGGRLDDGYICQPDAEVRYDISVWCAYDYAGNLSSDSDGVVWQVAAVTYRGQPDGEQAPSTPSEVWILWLLLAGVAALAICLSPIWKPSRKRSRRRLR